MGQRRSPGSIRTLDEDFFAVVVPAVLKRQGHPTLAVLDRRTVAREKLKRTAETVRAIVQFRRPPPKVYGGLIVVSDQPMGIAGIGAGRQLIEQLPQLG